MEQTESPSVTPRAVATSRPTSATSAADDSTCSTSSRDTSFRSTSPPTWDADTSGADGFSCPWCSKPATDGDGSWNSETPTSYGLFETPTSYGPFHPKANATFWNSESLPAAAACTCTSPAWQSALNTSSCMRFFGLVSRTK